ncbi:hypothetical protein TSAR_014168 [Trichomalopsis sarcophagae]|uniref:Tyr recombinase domain-containing protein n=1 Tax=Trichomalopsis sarcophagae TaxID=543379 RepID=A0A232FKK6_9HYME|nr:hypothetical protein TSAR_014168 [Trichomalopsis sarcophagae]
MERPYPGGRQVICQTMKNQGVSKAAMEIMISSICNTTLKNYDISFRKWWKFCNDHNIDVFKPNISSVISFLTGEYEKGLSYSSLNGIRSASSLIIAEDIAQDSRMKRSFQGISKSRPARPKYDRTWDPQIVLKFWQSQPANENLDLKDLSKKLITLLALVTAHCMQTFSLIDIDNIKINTNNIEILITDRIKTTKRNSTQPILTLPFYSNEKICAANTLKFYLEKTRSIRKDLKKLFISTNKPIKSVTAQTLSRWVKDALMSSGIDTTVFTAHSTRLSAHKKIGRGFRFYQKNCRLVKSIGDIREIL